MMRKNTWVYNVFYYKWYFIYLWRYFKSFGSDKHIIQVDWFLKLNGHKTLRRIWRKLHGF